ncbi:hypothetical protein Vadar_007336 [Vaccinium darrowii]|uniref:Uncharacterized protein n=1 Tax=Vaccinium darrowii TaxID=229202 RepID=A0ACB7Z361_9ERIC|nr:hypothetical protein Vadar_007336 [Vaccinium darrowii]
MAFSSIDLAVLRSWWDSFTAAEKELFKATFGGIASLLPVVITEGFLQAVCRFWCPSLNLFCFGMNELTPSVEEYHKFLQMSPSLDILARFPFRASPKLALSRLTGIKKSFVDVGVEDGIPVVNVEFLTRFFAFPGTYDTSQNPFMHHGGDGPVPLSRRVNALGFVLLAGLFFPREDGRLDMRVALYVEEILAGRTIIPILLAETFRSLTAFSLNPSGHFGGLSLAGLGLSFLPLVGLFGVVPYFGARITRQFGVIQEIPPDVSILPSARFCFDFPLSRADPLIQEAEAYWGERETVRPQSVTQCGKKKTETLEQTRAGLKEQINTLQAALNDARGTESSTSTLTALEDSLAAAESERDRLTRECLLLQEETMTLRESMSTLQGQFDALTLEREGLQQELVATQYAHGIERDQLVTMTTQLRSELSFAHGFYPSGELDASLVRSFLTIVENLSAVDTSGNVDEHTLLQYYRNALLVFQSILNGFAGGNP